ncbi:MAG: hypothetical protein ACYDCH_09240 [Gaiellaceae bacterium]
MTTQGQARQLDDGSAAETWPIPSPEVLRDLEAGPHWADLDVEEVAAA